MSVQTPDGYLGCPSIFGPCRGCAFDKPTRVCPQVRPGLLTCVACAQECGCSIIFVKTPESWTAGDRIWKNWVPPVKEEGPNESAYL